MLYEIKQQLALNQNVDLYCISVALLLQDTSRLSKVCTALLLQFLLLFTDVIFWHKKQRIFTMNQITFVIDLKYWRPHQRNARSLQSHESLPRLKDHLTDDVWVTFPVRNQTFPSFIVDFPSLLSGMRHPSVCLLTQWDPQQNGGVLKMTVLKSFSWKKIIFYLNLSGLLRKTQFAKHHWLWLCSKKDFIYMWFMTNSTDAGNGLFRLRMSIPPKVRASAGTVLALNQWYPNLLTHINATKPRWVAHRSKSITHNQWHWWWSVAAVNEQSNPCTVQNTHTLSSVVAY